MASSSARLLQGPLVLCLCLLNWKGSAFQLDLTALRSLTYATHLLSGGYSYSIKAILGYLEQHLTAAHTENY